MRGGPPTVWAMSDILGDASDADVEYDGEETGAGFFGDPTTLAFVAFPLAVASVLGAQVFRGLSYSVAVAPAAATTFTAAQDASDGSTAYIVIGAFLTAAFSLIPLALGLRGLRRVIDDDPTWLAGLLRAAVVLAGLSLVLRLLMAFILAIKIAGGPGPFFGYIGLLA